MESSKETDGDDGASSRSKNNKARFRKELDSLHREMEIAQHARTNRGHARRKLPRKESLERTKKRKLLEKDDRQQHAIRVEDGSEKRKRRRRGARAAMGDDVVHGSMIFGAEVAAKAGEDDENEMDVYEEGEVDDAKELDTEADEIIEDEFAADDADEEDEDDDLDEDAAPEQQEISAAPGPTAQPSETPPSVAKAGADKVSTSGGPKTGKKARRLMHQMRNFKSHRMAQRHGDALGAHARGLPKAAVEKLGQVAGDAPDAPQIYSSLGMVYENMFEESSRTKTDVANDAGNDEELQERTESGTDLVTNDDANREETFEKRLNLAKKAYGSYHVAALLCKKDHTLWVRAADMATEIADLHTQAMILPGLLNDAREDHRREKKRWIEEARQDYSTADNQKPPGIDIPAKLAAAHMDLGNLSEALTILSDLKDRSEFKKSYRALLLYSDLMLRVGFECTQWNKGIETNENYMFRRWLRKYSQTFDWRERRLQALCLALEAAAGSKSCSSLVRWIKERAKAAERPGTTDGLASANESFNLTGDASEKEDAQATAIGTIDLASEGNDVEKETGGDSLSAAKLAPPEVGDAELLSPLDTSESSRKDSLLTLTRTFERERGLLLYTHRSKLADFDKATEGLNLEPGSDAEQKRLAARAAVVKAQREAIVSLVGEFHQKKAAFAAASGAQSTEQQEEENSNGGTLLLPMSASCATVCSIASELIKHCLGLELCKGGRLVGEAVSSYLEERASVRDRRLASRNAFTRKQQSTDEAVLLNLEQYDEIRDDSEESDEDQDEAAFLSDDEEIERNEDGLVESLKRGSLPPELRVLYSLTLIGEGGRNYIAAKAIEGVNDLEPEGRAWLSEAVIDSGVTADPARQLFRLAMTEPLTKTPAFAFVADVVGKAGKEQEWSSHLAPLFQTHLDFLEEQGVVDQALALTSDTLKKNQVLKIIAAAARMKINSAESLLLDLQCAHVPSDPDLARTKKAVMLASSVVSAMTGLLRQLWSVESDGSISSRCIEILNVYARACNVLFKDATTTGQLTDGQFAADILLKLRSVVSLLSGVEIPNESESDRLDSSHSFESWTDFPVPNNWQTDSQRAVSKRMLNLCAACNVSLFSGWETDEFKVDLLRNRDGHKYFGIKIDGQRVAGRLTPEIELELSHQWERIGAFLPWTSSFDFVGGLSTVKDTAWYKSAKALLESDCKHETVSIYSEVEAIQILLAFSNACLFAAQTSTQAAKDTLVKTALSVILPITQFGLGQNLWNSPVGTAALKQRAINSWKQLPSKNREAPVPGTTGNSVSFSQTRAVARRPVVMPSVQDTTSFSKNFVRIPVSVLLEEWEEGATTVQDRSRSGSAEQAMRNVDIATRQLRACYTIGAVQKASIEVAVALLELVAQGGENCRNPFLCLQQAAIFASQGTKSGSSDENFREPLPSERECTALDALTIVGRADCLQAIHFPDEAIFLCSYVARVCSIHRDRTQPDLAWTGQWRTVRICAYNVSVAIHATVRSTLEKDSGKLTLGTWGPEVVEELDRGRVDAIRLKKSSSGKTAGIVSDDAPSPSVTALDVQGLENGFAASVDSHVDSRSDRENDSSVSWRVGALDAPLANGGFHETGVPADIDGSSDEASLEKIAIVPV